MAHRSCLLRFGSHGLAGFLLLLPIADGGADGVFRQHGAVDFHGRKRKFLHDIHVLDGESLVNGLALHPSGASDEEAIAEAEPKVLNLASSMTLVCGFTLICNFITSPHSGAPTKPVPTSVLLLSIEPTLRGWL